MHLYFFVMNNELIRRIKYYKELGFKPRCISKITGCTYKNVLKYTYSIKPKDIYNIKDTLAIIRARQCLKLRNSSS